MRAQPKPGPSLTRRAVAGVLAALAAGRPAAAITGRHDVAPDAYLVDPSEFPQVARLMGEVESTLVADRWLLTAAHTVEHGSPFLDWRAELNGRRYEIDKIVIHPRRIPQTVDSDYDLALVKLSAPAAGVTPARLYAATDEAQQEIIFVGRGTAGSGDQAEEARPRDGRMRRATNRVEAAFEHSLIFTFDPPPGGTRLEGISGAGDSGGPALLVKDGATWILGVGAFNTGDGRYGTVEGYARVSAHRAWIEATIAGDPPSSLPRWGPFVAARSPAALPRGPAGDAARAFIAALKAGRREDYAAFYARYGAPSTRPLEARVQGLADFRDQHGAFDLAGYRALGERSLAFFLHSRKSGSWQGGVFEVGPAGERLSSFNLGRLSPEVLAQFGLGDPR